MKTSKQQAEYLIDKFSKTQENNPKPIPGIPIVILDLEWVADIINQCTEKEFPILIQKTQTESFTIEPSMAHGLILFGHGALACRLTYDQFKEFTDGCIAICDWLNEQEDK